MRNRRRSSIQRCLPTFPQRPHFPDRPISRAHKRERGSVAEIHFSPFTKYADEKRKLARMKPARGGWNLPETLARLFTTLSSLLFPCALSATTTDLMESILDILFSGAVAAVVVATITEHFARRRFRIENFERLRRELRDDPQLLAVKQKLAPGPYVALSAPEKRDYLEFLS